MTRTLILMRHAKSSWSTPGLSDHERPLNDRGRRSATALGDWLRQMGHVPDEVISSSSRRTRETFDGLRFDMQANFTDDLYHAGAATMLKVLSRATGRTVLMLGHNPGIVEFAERIVRHPPDHTRFFDYPTGATLVVEFDLDDWTNITWKSGTVTGFAIPRELLA